VSRRKTSASFGVAIIRLPCGTEVLPLKAGERFPCISASDSGQVCGAKVQKQIALLRFNVRTEMRNAHLSLPLQGMRVSWLAYEDDRKIAD